MDCTRFFGFVASVWVLLVGIWPWSCTHADMLAVFPPSLATPFFTFAATFSSYFSFIFITHQEPSYMCSESCYGHQQPNCQIPGPFPGCLFQALFNICYLHFEYTVLTTFLFPADLLFSLLPPSAYSLMLVKPDSNHHSLPLMAFRSSSCLP